MVLVKFRIYPNGSGSLDVVNKADQANGYFDGYIEGQVGGTREMPGGVEFKDLSLWILPMSSILLKTSSALCSSFRFCYMHP